MTHSILEAAAPFLLAALEMNGDQQARLAAILWQLAHGNFRVAERERLGRQVQDLLSSALHPPTKAAMPVVQRNGAMCVDPRPRRYL